MKGTHIGYTIGCVCSLSKDFGLKGLGWGRKDPAFLVLCVRSISVVTQDKPPGTGR